MGIRPHSILVTVFLFLISFQFIFAETIHLIDGSSFEATVESIEDGNHILKIPKSKILQIKYKSKKGDKDYISCVSNAYIPTDILKYNQGNYYIKIPNNEIKSIDEVTKIDENYKFDAKSLVAVKKSDSPYFFRLHGSNTIGATLAPELVSGYLKAIGAKQIKVTKLAKEEQRVSAMLKGKKIEVEIISHGSTTGFEDLNGDKCEIAMASRRIKDEEVVTLQRFGNMKADTNEHVVAIDGVAVFVNQENHIFKLDTAQIKDIFSGKINNWSLLGGEDKKINLYARDEMSGTWDTFKSLILEKESLSPTAERFEDNTILSNKVAKDPYGIGFGGLPYILDSKELAISDGENTIRPDVYAVATEDYPLSRRLFFYTPTKSSSEVKAFVAFVLSYEGQNIVKDVGFVDLNVKSFKPILPEDLPESYLESVKQLSRLSVNFRFDSSSDMLDNKAKQDLDRLSKYFRNNSINKKAIYLFGFTDNMGVANINEKLSKKRAEATMEFFSKKGIKIDKNNISGFGESYPVANNLTERGKSQNRRVEIWVKR